MRPLTLLVYCRELICWKEAGGEKKSWGGRIGRGGSKGRQNLISGKGRAWARCCLGGLHQTSFN